MSSRAEVLLWAQRIVAKVAPKPHQLLEIKAETSADMAQEAFHKIARTAHPDLHRTTLSPEELELVTTAYARVAGAYQELRSARMSTTRMTPTVEDAAAGRRLGETSTQGIAVPTAPAPVPTAAGAAGAMNGKALIYYRKAEISLRRGDLKGALLQMKMAIAGDPQSTFLRTALAELQAELAKR